MLAYIFWHAPMASVDASVYEAALTAFQADLMRTPPPGLKSCASFRIGDVPWLDRPSGYEDWCFVGGSADLDTLNAAAVDARRRGSHDAVANKMEVGHGGLYRHVHGEEQPRGARALWLTRPRGIQYEPVLRGMIEKSTGYLSCWRRQMVLGPAAEFCIIGSDGLDLPLAPAWQALAVARRPLTPAAG